MANKKVTNKDGRWEKILTAGVYIKIPFATARKDIIKNILKGCVEPWKAKRTQKTILCKNE